MKNVDDSKFNMWRSLIALVHVDNLMHEDEVKFINEYLDRIPFSQEQKNILKTDLNSAKNVNEFYPLITDPADRSHFIYFARLLFWSDGVFQEQETKIFDTLKIKTTDKVDFVKTMKDLDKTVEDFERKHQNRTFQEKLLWFRLNI